jgi:hypothetical protein
MVKIPITIMTDPRAFSRAALSRNWSKMVFIRPS